MNTFDRRYQSDAQFRKLLNRRRDVDLTVAALELSRDAYPGLDFQDTLQWIEARAEELTRPVARAADEREALSQLAGCLAETHGICGDRASYGRAESSYLNRVIATRRGIPISLAILYRAVGEQVGLELRGVAAPMHFLARYESAQGPLFLDGFSSGRILTYDQCRDWLKGLSGVPVARIESNLEPAEPRSIIIRMLNNLKALLTGRCDWQAVWPVQHRLAALQPTSYEECRDLAFVSLWGQRPGFALDLLEACLENCPKSEEETIEKSIGQARRDLARCN